MIRFAPFLIAVFFATRPIPSLAHADGRVWQVVEPTAGMPTCEEFYDKWESPGAVPAGMMAMMGFAREVMAANDCLKQNNVPKACEHWSKLLVTAGKLGPPLSERSSEVEELMRQKNCEPSQSPAK